MRRNNKTLYEQIMRNVSREVKKTLNEANIHNSTKEMAIIKLLDFAHVDNLRLLDKGEKVKVFNGVLSVGTMFSEYDKNELTNEEWDELFFDIRDALYKEMFSDRLSKAEYDEFADWIYNKY